MHTQKLRQRKRLIGGKVDGHRDDETQDNRKTHEAVQSPAAAFEGRDERRADLQTDEKDKQHQAEITKEADDVGVDVDPEIAGDKAQKKHTGDAERYAEKLQAADKETGGNDKRIRQKRMRKGAGVGKKSGKPMHGGK